MTITSLLLSFGWSRNLSLRDEPKDGLRRGLGYLSTDFAFEGKHRVYFQVPPKANRFRGEVR